MLSSAVVRDADLVIIMTARPVPNSEEGLGCARSTVRKCWGPSLCVSLQFTTPVVSPCRRVRWRLCNVPATRPVPSLFVHNHCAEGSGLLTLSCPLVAGTVGWLNWVPEHISVAQTNSPDVVARELYTALHEVMHVLGGMGPGISAASTPFLDNTGAAMPASSVWQARG